MNARTRLSAKGQVVIPKDVRDHLRLKPGQELDVIETGGGVLLRPVLRKSGLSMDEVQARLRAILGPWKGPPLSVEDIDQAAKSAWRRSAEDSVD